MKDFKLQSPWVRFTNAVRELFKLDSEIRMNWDDETRVLNMYVDNSKKAAALRKILPEEKKFGKVTAKIYVYPSSGDKLNATTVEAATIEDAFEGNPLFSYTRSFELQTNPITYVVFKKKVIQYFEDDLDDLFCARSVLAEDLAREVFVNLPATHYSTDIKD